MKIVFQAFQWNCLCSVLSLESFLATLNQLSGNRNRKRVLYFIESTPVWVGLVLTVKDMRKFVTLVESGQEVKLDVHTLKENEKIADFNFFIVDPKTGFGLYQHYHHSCSLNIFNLISKSFYKQKVLELRVLEEERLKKDGKTPTEIKRFLKKFDGKFITTIIERKGSFAERVSNLSDAKGVELEFQEICFSNNPLQAIQSHLKSVKYKMSFLNTTSAKSKVKTLANIFFNVDLKRATVEGIDEHGNDVAYRLFNDFDRFKEYDYEAMVPSLNLDKTKINDSILQNSIVTELRNVFKEIEPVLAK